MIKIYLGLFGISVLVNFINYFFAKMESPTYIELFKMALYMLPLQFLVGLGFAFYYSKGIQFMPFALLSTIYYPVTIAVSVVVGMFFFKEQTLSTYDMLGIVFTVLGLSFFMLSKVQGA